MIQLDGKRRMLCCLLEAMCYVVYIIIGLLEKNKLICGLNIILTRYRKWLK